MGKCWFCGHDESLHTFSDYKLAKGCSEVLAETDARKHLCLCMAAFGEPNRDRYMQNHFQLRVWAREISALEIEDRPLWRCG